MKYLPLPVSLFQKNRERFVRMMKPNSLAIIVGNPLLSTNGDALYTYKPNSDLFWLTGIVQEKSMLILYPDNPDKSAREVLVLLKPNPDLEKWEGHKLRKDEARALSGIENVQWAEGADSLIQVMMHHAETVYLNTNENDRLDPGLFRPDLLFVSQFMQRYPLHRYERAARLFSVLRAVKTEEEVEVIKKAVDITHKAFRRVLGFVRPGVYEYEIEAEITHEFLRNRASGHAYDCIIASGDRARVLHYVENNQVCQDGELLLMDFGAAYGNYASDLTRTIPVNGKFTKRQKEVYEAVLHVHQFASSILQPGISVMEYTRQVNQEMEKQLVRIGLLSPQDMKNQDPDNPAYRRYFYHGVSHHMGIDVHDLGTRTAPIEEGMVFTVEPGIYIEEEQMGIRIENNFWVRKGKNIDLFEGIPITVEEIESAMAGK